MRLLDQHYDPALDVDVKLDAEAISAAEVHRLQAEVAAARVAAAFPRRLSDATRDELALDKKRSRRVAHALEQSLRAWGGEPREPDDDDRRAGAQVDWPLWWEEREPQLAARLRYVTTWAKKTGLLRFGKTAITRLEQEREWLGYALRD